MNLAIKHAMLHEGVRALRFAYDGCCIDFVDQLLHRIEGHPVDKVYYLHCRLVYFETPWHRRWRYHAALELHGLIHDLWYREVVPTSRFMKTIGSNEVSYPGEDDYEPELQFERLTRVMNKEAR